MPQYPNSNQPISLHWLAGRYAVCRLTPAEGIPAWAAEAAASPCDAPGFISITRTDREVSIVLDEDGAPPNVKAQRGLLALQIDGELDFALLGILATLTGALAKAGVPVFVISTFDTDLLLVPAALRSQAQTALNSVANVHSGS